MQVSTHDNIVLIGMPGAGKSTVGVVLAKMLNRDFVDVDLVIQKKHGKTLQDLIRAEGPEGFIALEGQALCALDVEGTVIATGGSAVYSEEGMRHLQDLGQVIYLQLPFAEVSARVGDLDERGVVFRQEGEFDLQELFNERDPLYRKYANTIVEVSNLPINKAAEKVAHAK